MSEEYLAWPCIFRRLADQRFEISVTAWSVMQHFRQIDVRASEAGGVLLGRHLHDESAIIVDAITTPLPSDRRSRTRFYRSQQHQVAIDQAWRNSHRTCTYLGEWHTHPEAIPTPSPIDHADWQRRLQADQFTEPLFFIIVGTQQTCVWEGTRSGIITPLVLYEV